MKLKITVCVDDWLTDVFIARTEFDNVTGADIAELVPTAAEAVRVAVQAAAREVLAAEGRAAKPEPERTAALVTPEPDWSKAPDWANWFACDGDGRGFWYANEPNVGNLYHAWRTDGQYKWIETLPACPGWRNTLRRRPEVQS